MKRPKKGRNRLTAISFMILFLIALSSPPAHAVRCNEWLELAPNDRNLKVKELIRELLDSPKAAQWTSINKSRIERCLTQQTSEIEIDFQEACSQGSQAPVDVLDEVLLRHARTCAQTTR